MAACRQPEGTGPRRRSAGRCRPPGGNTEGWLAAPGGNFAAWRRVSHSCRVQPLITDVCETARLFRHAEVYEPPRAPAPGSRSRGLLTHRAGQFSGICRGVSRRGANRPNQGGIEELSEALSAPLGIVGADNQGPGGVRRSTPRYRTIHSVKSPWAVG